MTEHDQTTLPDYLLKPVREITALLERRLTFAASALREYRGIEDSPHVQDWRDQVALLTKARAAWQAFLVEEGLADE